jgi:hypothetical protein
MSAKQVLRIIVVIVIVAFAISASSPIGSAKAESLNGCPGKWKVFYFYYSNYYRGDVCYNRWVESCSSTTFSAPGGPTSRTPRCVRNYYW